MKYFLFTTHYVAEDNERNLENQMALKANLSCEFISKIFLLIQHPESKGYPDDEKIHPIILRKRPTFSDFFREVNKWVNGDQICIVANSDIYFDNSLRLFEKISFQKTLVTLSRYDILPEGGYKFYNRYLSQDTWAFGEKVPENIGDYYIGQHGCDNRLLYEFEQKGWDIKNPSLVVKSFHVHMSNLRPYFNNPNYKRVEPPYKYICPSGLISPQRMLFKKLLSLKGHEIHTFSLSAYFLIRFEFNLKKSKNELQQMKVSLGEQIKAAFLRPFFYFMFQLSKFLGL